MAKRLQVWWVPQVPMKAFEVEVTCVSEGVKVLDVLADYDAFQYDNNIKPDYANAGGLNQWSDNIDGAGTAGWEDWYDEETMEYDPWIFCGACE